jgi:arginine utilization protein RocB
VNSVPFEISLIAEGGILFIGVRVPEAASESDIEIVITKLVEAFASVEHLDEREMQHLLFDDLSDAMPEASPGFIVRRPYTDPHYPAKIDSALKRLTSSAPTLH